MEGGDFGLIIEVLRRQTEGISIKLLFVFLFLEAVIVFGGRLILRKKKNIRLKRCLFFYVFLVYIDMLLMLTIFRRPTGSREGIVISEIKLGFGFKTGAPSIWAGTISFLNIVLFIPFGSFIYLQFRNLKRFKGVIVTMLIGGLTSLMVECTQFITGRGILEITDLLTNTLGCLLGAAFTAFVIKRKRNLK